MKLYGQMTDADKVMNPQHFGSDPPDIRIQINLEIWIRILDQNFCWDFDRGGVCALWMLLMLLLLLLLMLL